MFHCFWPYATAELLCGDTSGTVCDDSRHPAHLCAYSGNSSNNGLWEFVWLSGIRVCAVGWWRDLAAEIIKGSHPVYLHFLPVIDGKWHFCGSSALWKWAASMLNETGNKTEVPKIYRALHHWVHSASSIDHGITGHFQCVFISYARSTFWKEYCIGQLQVFLVCSFVQDLNRIWNYQGESMLLCNSCDCPCTVSFCFLPILLFHVWIWIYMTNCNGALQAVIAWWVND